MNKIIRILINSKGIVMGADVIMYGRSYRLDRKQIMKLKETSTTFDNAILCNNGSIRKRKGYPDIPKEVV